MTTPNPNKIKAPPSVKTTDDQTLFDRIATEVIRESRDLFDTLNAHERSMVIKWLSDAIVTGKTENAMHDLFWEIDFDRKPVPVEQFIEDDHYIGRVTKDLYPKWKEDLSIVLRPGSKIAEWIMTGGIGVGKTTVADVALAYKLYYLSCVRNPAAYYGLLPDSLIVFGIYSITKRQVSDSGYLKLKGFIDQSPYFRQTFPRNPRLDSRIDFTDTTKKAIQIIPGSQQFHALGLDVFAYMMDEANFMRVKNDKEAGVLKGQAQDIYLATSTRVKSRYMRPGGSIPGLMLALSSRNAETSFLESKIAAAKDDPTVYVSDYTPWDLKPRTSWRLPWFKVEIGDRTARSRILDDTETPRTGAKIIRVPGEFKREFFKDCDQALRDIAGVATFNLSPLIHDRQSVTDAVRPHLSHPFTRKTISISISDPVKIEDFFDIKTACIVRNSRWMPRLNPGSPRFLHIDIGLTGDCAGMAMGHVPGIVKVTREKVDGTYSEESVPYTILDMMLRITPPRGDEIDLSKIRSFVFYLARLYNIQLVTFDGFQSRDCMQLIKKQGIDSKIISLDRDEVPYLGLRGAMYERRLIMYEYQPFIDEVLDLQRNIKQGKVDHPPTASNGERGSKDVADAVCGVVFNCMNDERAVANVPILDHDSVSTARQFDPTPTTMKKAIGVEERVVAGQRLHWSALRDNLSKEAPIRK